MNHQAPVLIMAGGTGGHIFPGLAVAEVLRAQGVPVAWMGAHGGMETRLVAERGIDMYTVAVHGLRGRGWRRHLQAPWMLLRALYSALAIVRRLRPRSVLSMGGYVAGPGGVAAWLLRRPLLVHEQNSVAGATNKILAHLARKVMCGFAGALPDAQWVGNPVRASIAALPEPAQRLGTRHGRARLLVFGGSLGAQALNAMLPQVLAAMPPQDRPDVWHQCGANALETTRAAYTAAAVDARIEPFIDNMVDAYAWADLAVCRAGALTLAELCGAGLGSILVPFPQAVDDHQSANARSLVACGAAVLEAQTQWQAAALTERLMALLADRSRLLSMAEAARGLAKADAAEVIAQACLEVAV